MTRERRARRCRRTTDAGSRSPAWPTRNEVVVDARLPYVTDGEGMHTFTDPVDGERYVGATSAWTSPSASSPASTSSISRRRSRCSVSRRPGVDGAVERAAARALTAGRAGSSRPPRRSRAICSCSWPGRGTRVTLEHARPARWAGTRAGRWPPSWTATSQSCAGSPSVLRPLRRLFDEPFPFDSYDQVFVPELNWGAMENPGCVTVPRRVAAARRVTEDDRRRRAMVIAHEMSHMWFGDLVTPSGGRTRGSTSLSRTTWASRWRGRGRVRRHLGRLRRRPTSPAPCVADRRRSTHPVAPAARGRARRGHRSRRSSTPSPTARDAPSYASW